MTNPTIRWLLAFPLYLTGFILAPIIFHIAWDLGLLAMPQWDFLLYLVEVVKSALSGFCSAWFASEIVPSHQSWVALGCAFLTLFVMWSIVQLLGDANTFVETNILVAVIAGFVPFFVRVQQKR